MLKVPKSMWLVFVALLYLPLHLLSALAGKTYLKGWSWNQDPFHVVLESVGSFAALLVAYFLLRVHKGDKGQAGSKDAALIIRVLGLCMLARGVLAAGYPVVDAEQAYLWLHTWATVIGGVVSALWALGYWWFRGDLTSLHSVWCERSKGLDIYLTLGLTSVLLAVSALFPSSIPQMVSEQGEPTRVALVLNVVSCLAMLMASSCVFRAADLVESGQLRLYGFVLFGFGLSSLTIVWASGYQPIWFLWYGIRFALYGVLLHEFLQAQSRQVLKEQRSFQSRYSLALAAAQTGVWDWDVKRNRLIWDDQMHHLYGIEKTQFSGAYEAWQSVLHPEDKERASAEVYAALRGEAKFDTEFRIQTSSKGMRWIKSRADVFFEGGQPVRMTGVNWDNTDARQKTESLRRAERELTRSRHRLRKIADTIPTGVVTVNRDFIIEFANKTYLRWRGMAESQMVGKSVEEITGRELFAKIKPRLKVVLDGQEDSYELDPVEFIPGEKRVIHVQNMPETDDKGRIVGIVSVLTDLSMVRQRERLLEEAKALAEAASSSKSAFLANMSHEIRTPMNAILGMVELLAETQLDNLQQRYLHTLNRSGENLLLLINDILDMSKIEAGQLDIDKHQFDLEELLAEVFEVLRVKAAEKKQQLLLLVDPSVNYCIEADNLRIRQILVNLLGNAIKFTDHGKDILVEVGFETESNQLAVSIIDSGVGIAPSRIASIFEAFTQENAGVAVNFGGTGLGLPISKRLAQLMGGDITVKSQKGVGSTFSLIMPYTPVDDPQISGYETYARAFREKSAHLSHKRVLIIEEHQLTGETVARWLSLLGLQVDLVSSMAVGLDYLKAATKIAEDSASIDYSGVVCPVKGQHMTGLELKSAGEAYARLNNGEVHGVAKSSPCFHFTAMSMRDEDYKALQVANIAGVLWKPLSRMDVLRMAERVFLPLDETTREAQVKASDDPASSLLDSDKTLSLLVVDDQNENRFVIEQFLKAYGWRLRFAEDGLEALEMYEKENYDLILMDLKMPRLDGYKAIQLIRERERVGRQTATPIIALSAFALKSEVHRAMSLGCNDYVSKPVRKSMLLQSLKRVLHDEMSSQDLELEADKEPNPSVHEQFRSLIPTLIESRKQDLKRLGEAMQNEDYQTIARVGHSIKGLPLGMCMDDLRPIGAEIEQAASSREGVSEAKRQRLYQLLEDLERAVLKIKESFEAEQRVA